MEVEGSGLDYVSRVPRTLSLLLPGPSRTRAPSRTSGQGHILVPSLWLPYIRVLGQQGKENARPPATQTYPLVTGPVLLDAHRTVGRKSGCSRRCGERRDISWKQAPWEGEPGRMLVASALPRNQGAPSRVPGRLRYKGSMEDCVSPLGVTTASAPPTCCQPSPGRLPPPQRTYSPVQAPLWPISAAPQLLGSWVPVLAPFCLLPSHPLTLPAFPGLSAACPLPVRCLPACSMFKAICMQAAGKNQTPAWPGTLSKSHQSYRGCASRKPSSAGHRPSPC